MRKCIICKEEKKEKEFYFYKTENRYSSQCKSCKRRLEKEKYKDKEFREKKKAIARESYYRNKGKVKLRELEKKHFNTILEGIKNE